MWPAFVLPEPVNCERLAGRNSNFTGSRIGERAADLAVACHEPLVGNAERRVDDHVGRKIKAACQIAAGTNGQRLIGDIQRSVKEVQIRDVAGQIAGCKRTTIQRERRRECSSSIHPKTFLHGNRRAGPENPGDVRILTDGAIPVSSTVP